MPDVADDTLYRPLSLSRRTVPFGEAGLAWSPPPALPRPRLGATLARSLRWSLVLQRALARLAWAWLAGRWSTRTLGVVLRDAFQQMGGTAAKIGQQLSMRVDLLPAEVCDELSALNDRAGPIPFEEARAAVERAVGGPLEGRFACFDPEPVGAASVACVYKAVLKSGEAVAVKVQRPTAARDFASDLRAFDAYTRALEAVGVVRGGFFEFMRRELRAMFLEELDFVREARYQRLYRRYAERDGLDWLTAPRVHAELSDGRVVVSEFVDGVSCAEVVRAVEGGEPAAMERLRAMDIDPDAVAERLLHVSIWGRMESPFFHADPHPANILVLPGGRVCMIDFGSCGTNASGSVRNHRAVIPRLVAEDIEGVKDVALRDMAPVPRVDLDALADEMRTRFWSFALAAAEEGAPWNERTTASLWLNMTDLARKFEIPVNLDTLRFVRATMAYDTLAFRINPRLSSEHTRRYLRQATRRDAARARRRGRRGGRRAAGPWLRERVELAERLASRLMSTRAAWQSSLDEASQLGVWFVQSALFAGAVWGAAALVVLWRSGGSFEALWRRPLDAMSRHPVGALALAAGGVIALSFAARLLARLRRPARPRA